MGSIRQNSDLNLQLNQLLNARVHVYSSESAANADVSGCTGRFCYVTETNKFLMGVDGTWVAVNFAIEIVATVDDLPEGIPPDGQMYLVLQDNSYPNLYVGLNGDWQPVRGSNKFDTVVSNITADFDMSAMFNRNTLVLTSFAADTTAVITLPVASNAANKQGDVILIKDILGGLPDTASITVTGKIDGDTRSIELTLAFQCTRFVYVDTSIGWLLESEM